MELKEFITNTLINIAEGANGAKDRYKTLGGVVNPEITSKAGLYQPTKERINVEFEVALSDTTSHESSAGIGVLFNIVTIGGKTGISDEIHSVNKIKFTVPVELP